MASIVAAVTNARLRAEMAGRLPYDVSGGYGDLSSPTPSLSRITLGVRYVQYDTIKDQ